MKNRIEIYSANGKLKAIFNANLSPFRSDWKNKWITINANNGSIRFLVNDVNFKIKNKNLLIKIYTKQFEKID